MNPLEIIEKYYVDNAPLRALLLHHSQQVTNRALAICKAHPELGADEALIYRGAMLHDIGIFLTDAPAIHCHGTAHYLYHGILGARLMRKEGMEDVARICERHTGTGLTSEVLSRRGLTLPPGDYQPHSLEEKIVCYADKFYSKSHPERCRTIPETVESLKKFGQEGVQKFLEWAARFEDYRPDDNRD